eukprot:NODE_67_length_25542_cov_1.476831.p12 type:complete len:256 gc:universal NODE_67_length_25542_cov_1.476831:16537-17304(+)
MPQSPRDFKVIIVTGCSKGIGKATVDELFKLYPDAKVIGVARSEKDLEQLKKSYENFDYIAGSLTNKTTIFELTKLIDLKYRRVDALIANAGVLNPINHIPNIDMEEFRYAFEVNFFSVVSLIKELWVYIRNGRVILNSSGAATHAYHGLSAYCSSKAALNMFGQSISKEGGFCLAVRPGVVSTGMQDQLRASEELSPDDRAFFKNLKEEDKLISPQQTGALFAKLALGPVKESWNGAFLSHDDLELAEFMKESK